MIKGHNKKKVEEVMEHEYVCMCVCDYVCVCVCVWSE